MSLPPPRLLAIGDRRSLDAPLEDWLDAIGRIAASAEGLLAVQLREKDLDDRELHRLVVAARRRLPATVRLLVNGRADVALAAGADGVHLPATGLPVPALRELAARHGRPLLIGRSAHDLDAVRAAREEGADYVLFGPVWPTPGKPAGPGIPGLAAASALAVPVLALGGVTAERLAMVADAGAWGAAAIRAFRDPRRAARLIARAVERYADHTGAPG